MLINSSPFSTWALQFEVTEMSLKQVVFPAEIKKK